MSAPSDNRAAVAAAVVRLREAIAELKAAYDAPAADSQRPNAEMVAPMAACAHALADLDAHLAAASVDGVGLHHRHLHAEADWEHNERYPNEPSWFIELCGVRIAELHYDLEDDTIADGPREGWWLHGGALLFLPSDPAGEAYFAEPAGEHFPDETWPGWQKTAWMFSDLGAKAALDACAQRLIRRLRARIALGGADWAFYDAMYA